MKAYLTTLLLVCAVSAIATAISPEGRQKTYIQFVLGIVVLTVILAPIAGDFGELTLPQLPSAEGEADVSPVFRATEVALREAIAEQFRIPSGWITVEVLGTFEEEQLQIQKVNVTLREGAKSYGEEIELYLKGAIQGGCEIFVRHT